MQTALPALQSAIYARLKNYQPLMDKVTGVWDDVPQTYIDDSGNTVAAAFPYVTLDVASNIAEDTKLSIGEHIVWQINTFSRYSGKSESYNLLNLIMQALQAPLSLEGGFFIASYVPGRPTVIMDADGVSYHGILTLNFLINQ
ncbi:DUF3168 domain-containing protein [Sporolactobacillus sp. KGMB 08714]|uniref:DUF3168 domain-containing protein n=1 Tax=Sporolactobacillus sp. KGMB 08714 TaxID=3064704 RepID=UPI002FBD45F7